MIAGIDVISAITLVSFATIGGYATCRALADMASARKVLPELEEQPALDPDWAMECLMDAVAASTNGGRGEIYAGGVRVAAWWATSIEVGQSGTPVWSRGYWVVEVDGYQGPCATLESAYQLGLDRLRAIVAERAECYADRRTELAG